MKKVGSIHFRALFERRAVKFHGIDIAKEVRMQFWRCSASTWTWAAGTIPPYLNGSRPARVGVTNYKKGMPDT